ncbi:helix-turn-helix domain-containing protein [Methanosphaerula palustris]|nr:hypothetical protein [Methanosphaerula palustris]
MIQSGTVTHAEIADDIGITREQLADRLALMERQGYLARQEEMADSESGCRHCCASCCARNGASFPVLYNLTQKGERLAEGTGSI